MYRKKSIMLCAWMAIMIALTSLTPLGALCAPAKPKPGNLTINLDSYPVVDGSTATLPLSYALMSKLTGISDEQAMQRIRHSKTTQSFYSMVSGSAQLLLVYEPSQEALDYAADRGVKLEFTPIGLDALVFLINETNSVDSLSYQQLLGIYTGEITNWNQVGGADMPIVAYQRSDDSGSQVMMRGVFMKETPLAEAPTELKPAEMGGLIDELAAYRDEANAIGYSVYYYVNNMYMQPGVKLLKIDGVAPDNESIASGAYPYSQVFNAVIRADAPAASAQRKIAHWLTTNEGRELIESAGYVAMPYLP